jgi:hypothetical protein
VSNVTRSFNGVQRGDLKAAEELLPLLCVELRKLAAHIMTAFIVLWLVSVPSSTWEPQ